ncbi:MAG TPA: S26 family signal peptidase [Dehalococcoidia bacterium]|nr:S26 family signal peptidase [Dehalococcoidia bacterium]
MKKLVGVVFGLGLLLSGLLSGRVVRRFVVGGRSMLRAYAPGDRLVVEGVSYRFRAPRIGEVVVVRQPGADGRLDLKRIAAGPGAEVTVRGAPDFLGNQEWYVLGDNLDESTDSRELGPVQTGDVVGRVWFRY